MPGNLHTVLAIRLRLAVLCYDLHDNHDTCPESKMASRRHKPIQFKPSTTNQRTDAAHLATEVVLRAQELVDLQRAREAVRVRNGVHSGGQSKEVMLEVHVAQYGSERSEHYWAETHHHATANADDLNDRPLHLARYIIMRRTCLSLTCPPYAAPVPRNTKVAI